MNHRFLALLIEFKIDKWDTDFTIFATRALKMSKWTMPSTLITVVKHFRGVQITKVFVEI